ncbi:alpha/beta fold hydrolase [Calothrix sp. 336/3]|uniref:alpha/beta fold hydrolase n=1 Tax=Calothrix sp. 336/3 TaxID=1337936 RepID=UPI0004E33A9F|nr:alpha/beta hydrolase [Calothrix sp. 336/3]AKG20011.1 alpha/beta hydrolase [Calothrix sp. 336/3]
MLSSKFYTWHNYRCVYDLYPENGNSAATFPILLIHPIGVGLSRHFWDRFCRGWQQHNQQNLIYNSDLLGCGESDKPHVAYYPHDWAAQLQYFVENIIQKPVIIIVQGALLPIALELSTQKPHLVAGLILAGPPAIPLISQKAPIWQQKLIWNLLDSGLGKLFYRYARREKFLADFSARQLFNSATDVDKEWLDSLGAGAEDLESRHAVFAFLAGFWLQGYREANANLQQPTLVVVGEGASSISKAGKKLSADQWLADYLAILPQGEGVKIPGRNVLPYESTTEFIQAIAPFVQKLS